MDKQKTHIQEMEDMFATIQIEDEEHGGLSYKNITDELSDIDTRWCLVGRFLTDSSIDFQAMQHKMTSWRPGRGLYVKQLDNNKFIFQFSREIDIRRVTEGSPWTFGRFHLVLERLKDGDNPRTVEIKEIDLWVQLHGICTSFMSQRVATDIDTPIKRRMKLQKSQKEWCWVNFKYEAIPTFCFIYGIIGHGERFCDRIFDTLIESIEKPYGAWLRADPRRKTHTMGAKWLRNGGRFQVKNSGEGGDGFADKDSPEKDAQVQQLSTKSGIGLKDGTVDKGEIADKFCGNTGKINQIEPNQINIQNSNISLEENANGPDTSDLIVVDPKRPRMGLNHDKIISMTQDQVTEMEA
ncbi:hypothetical protein POM88_015970 [Heracleum sosnowskyi]|uniref:DUF4283 domain-containing protein n=1 Tax=Heracleum sosnowskyi TaxID=360622 RepID=A0AAD8INV4_9APIA|nr:hypothetical protein POM88_015970 [Heracleum sosnowskyi]